MTPLEFDIPVRVSSGDNRRDGHWGARQRRVQKLRASTAFAWMSARNSASLRTGWTAGHPLTVTMTRVAPRALDGDGAASALKPVRDELAKLLGLPSDKGPRVLWRVRQARGAPNAYAVRVRVEERPATCSECETPLAVEEPGTWDLVRCPNADCVYRAPRRRRHG